MSEVRLIVVFDTDLMPRRQVYKSDARKQFIEQGIERVREQFPDIKWGEQYVVGASAVATLARDDVSKLRAFLKESRLGWTELDRDILTAAGHNH